MLLKQLIITDYAGERVREDIDFKLGLNLIVGVVEKDGTTNNIGKTTLIRCIDFCLGGKLEQFYADKEDRKMVNRDIVEFLIKKQPTFILSFSDISANHTYRISRSIEYSKEKLGISEESIYIEDSKIDGDFLTELKKIFFNNLEKKPTFRQLIPKFVRKDESQINNILKYLHITTTSQDYEKIHLFLFGFGAKTVLQRKSELEHTLKTLKKSKDALASRFSATDLKQILEITKKDLEKLYITRDKFQLDDKYEIEEQQLKNIQMRIVDIERLISDANLKKSLTESKLKELQDGIFENDTNALKLLYDEAKFYSEKLHKTFDDVVVFHNKMIHNEIIYLESKISEYDRLINDSVANRRIYTQQYSALMQKLSKTGSLAEYTKLNEQIEKLAEKKGQNEKLLEELGKLEEEIKKIEEELLTTKQALDANLEEFDNRLLVFNQSFSTYSRKLYDEEFILSYDKDEEPIKFYTKNIEGNQGSGKKQSIISAFDLAYIDFVNKLGLSFPRFVAHDKVELIDINKLKGLFEIANNVTGQYIVPIIEDKIKPIIDEFGDSVILTLSEENKFFGV